MAEQLIKFIKGETNELNDKEHKLYDKPFERECLTSNGGINHDEIIKWVSLINGKDFKFNNYVLESRMIEQKITPNQNEYKLIRIPGHSFVQYVHDNIIETYDSAKWQSTTNNCTLYAALVLVIRPHVTNMTEMMELLKMIQDKPHTESCNKLAKISEYYFGRGIEWFRYSNKLRIPLGPKENTNKTLWVYFHGLNPQGALHAYSITEEFRKIKGNDFQIYFRSENTPYKEFNNFCKWFMIQHNKYNKFIFVGHSYGSLFANYFAQSIIEKSPNWKDNITSVSLDGSDLVETMEYVAYELLKLNRSNKIEYGVSFATCDSHNLPKEWYNMIKNPIIENTYIDWYESAYICSKFSLNHKHIMFSYYDNKENPNQLNIINKGENIFEIHYLKEYSHSMHKLPEVAKEIIKIINA